MQLKHFASALLSACMLAAAVPAVPASAETADFSYTVLEDGSVSVYCNDPELTEVRVPASIDGYSVSALADSCFSQNAVLTEITLPARLRTIYEIILWADGEVEVKSAVDVFYNNKSLAAIHVEEGNEFFTSIDGVLYERNEKGVVDTLLLCPRAKTGNLVISKEIRMVENGAFYGTKLSKISFNFFIKKISSSFKTV